MCKIISIVNSKGGVGKTSVTANLGIGLAREGYRVALIDSDPQGSLSVSLGYAEPDAMGVSLVTVLEMTVNGEAADPGFGMLHHAEGVDLMPGNIELSGFEVSLLTVMSREFLMKEYVEALKPLYDYIIIDCMPSLGALTLNALCAADSVLIPVQAAYLPVKGFMQLMRTIGNVKRRLNPELEIEGILLTMVDLRTNFARDICRELREQYGEKIHIFENEIPFSVRAAEATAEGVSIFSYDGKGKVAAAYEKLTKEVIGNGR